MSIEDTILTMFDRICHESTSDIDRRQTIEGVRRKLRGELPSAVLRQATDETIDEEIAQLRQQLADAEHKNAELEQSIDNLSAQLKPQPVDGFYTMEQFIRAMGEARGRLYGWRTDYIEATKHLPGALLAETATIQHWQAKDQVPSEFYEQISRLEFRKRSGKGGPPWSETEYQYLVNKYEADPKQKNKSLAEMCSSEFGRDITENSIRGAIDRERKRGHLPKRRPGRKRHAG